MPRTWPGRVEDIVQVGVKISEVWVQCGRVMVKLVLAFVGVEGMVRSRASANVRGW